MCLIQPSLIEGSGLEDYQSNPSLLSKSSICQTRAGAVSLVFVWAVTVPSYADDHGLDDFG